MTFLQRNPIRTLLPLLGLGLLGAQVPANAEVKADSADRQNVTSSGLRAERDQGFGLRTVENVYEDSAASGRRSVSATRAAATTSSKPGAATAPQDPNTNFWFFTADVVLFNDQDQDGYFHGIDLLFDADTVFTAADVYAVVYLSLDGGEWVEYAATENFTLEGATSDDEFIVVTELVSGYPTGSYDLLIELFDAFDDSFVAFYGPEDTSELAFLPLEDVERDTPFQGPEVIVVEERGGGAAGIWLLLALAGMAMRRAQKA